MKNKWAVAMFGQKRLSREDFPMICILNILHGEAQNNSTDCVILKAIP